MLNLPNAITLTRIALVVVFTAAVSIADRYSWGYVAALVTFILAACTDWLDGYLARRLNQVTTFGKLIDPLADKIAVSAAFIYLTGVELCPVWATILIISREFLVTGLRQIAQDHGIIIPAGTSGKWKTAFQLAFCIACLLALTWTHTPEYLPSFLDQPVARIRSLQFPVPVHAVGLHHPDRLFRGRLLRGRAQIFQSVDSMTVNK
jgi:CDP-diacylglycerol--glycerol-3-phosphate 3-phosphatidyltransferase